MRPFAIAALALTLASCGGPSSQYERNVEPELDRQPAAPDSPEGMSAEQTALQTEFDEELSRPEVDCTRACDLAGRICGLADRICTIAAQRESVASLCTDARGRCETDRARTAERCQCSGE
jgi:hypothetical protein